jgi:hypothetical protein
MKKENLKVIDGIKIESLWVRKDLNGANTLQVGWQEIHSWGLVNWDFNFGEGGVLGVGREVVNKMSKLEEVLVFEVMGTALRVKVESTNGTANHKLGVTSLTKHKDQLVARSDELTGLGVSVNPIKAMVKKLEEMIEERTPQKEKPKDLWKDNGIPSIRDIYHD